MATCLEIPDVQDRPIVQVDGRQLADLVGELCEVAQFDVPQAEYFRRCFEAVCRHFDVISGILNIRQGPRTMEQTWAAESASGRWSQVADSLVLRAQTDQATLVKAYRTKAGKPAAHAIATPVFSSGGKVFGGVSLVVGEPRDEQARVMLAQLMRLLELIVENAPSVQQTKQTEPSGESQTLKSVVRATDYRSIYHLSFAIVNSLCSKLGCEQVSLALVRGRDIRMLAVSGLDQVPKNTPGMSAVQQAMSVCLDLDKTSVVQQDHQVPGQLESSPCRLHNIWHRVTGGSAVATIPLYVDRRCVAIIALRRKENQPFLQEDIDRARILAQSFAPALPLVDRASRSLVRHGLESGYEWSRRIASWNHLGYKLAAVLLLALAGWFVFGRMDYQVLANCRIVPEHTRIISAPYEGKVAEVAIAPGQKVEPGDLLIRMDTRDLRLEESRVRSEIASANIEKEALLRERKPDEAFLKMSQIGVLETDLKRIQEQLQRSQVRASRRGIVLPTEIHRRVGQFVTLGEPLLEVAEETNWQLEINTPESDARHLRAGQTGRFQSSARPDQSFPCRVINIHPAASVVNRKNVVVVEASLLEREPWMRVGMEGSVRIRTAPQPVWWVYTHPVLDYLRLKLWL